MVRWQEFDCHSGGSRNPSMDALLLIFHIVMKTVLVGARCACPDFTSPTKSKRARATCPYQNPFFYKRSIRQFWTPAFAGVTARPLG